MALLDTAALRMALARHANLPAAQRSYARQRRFHMQLYQSMSLLLTPLFQSRGRLLPGLRDFLSKPVTYIPGVPWLLACAVAGKLGLFR